MASNKDFQFEFEMLLLDLKKGRKEDLQLTAELGKILLERNQELEINIKQKQTQIDDHLLEIEYLTKHNVALREVNETRLGCYENLESAILELERTIDTLMSENASLRKENKTLSMNAETSESRCDELNRQMDDLTRQYKNEKRRNDRITQEQSKRDEMKRIELLKPKMNVSLPCDVDKYNPLLYSMSTENIFALGHLHNPNMSSSSINEDTTEIDGSLQFSENNEKNEEFLRVLHELEGKKRQCLSEQNRIADLEQQLQFIIEDNNALQSRLAQASTQEEIKSVHEELSILDEVRHGKMCIRCLRNANDDEDYEVGDDDFSIVESDDGGNQSLISNEMVNKTYHSSISLQPSTLDISLHNVAPSPNPYLQLEQKYEALLEVQRQPTRSRQLTLQNEITSDDTISINAKDTEDDRSRFTKVDDMRPQKKLHRTSTNLCEAETLSSEFSDEISNKSTQTEENVLCPIADGENKISTSDDVAMSPIDSHLGNRLECRKSFKEIFSTLKTAEIKEENEGLPSSLSDNNSFKTPPCKPANDGRERKPIIVGTVEKVVQRKGSDNKSPYVLPDGRVLTPLQRDPLEYIAVSVNVRRKNRRKTRGPYLDRSESSVIPTSPQVYVPNSSKKKRDFRSIQSTSFAAEWNGTSITIFNKTMQSPTLSSINSSIQSPQVGKAKSEFRRAASTASQDLYKLRKLELSYAEVLRKTDSRNHSN